MFPSLVLHGCITLLESPMVTSRLNDPQESEENFYQQKMKQATWVPHLFRISVAQHEYNGEKRQRITARAVVPVDFAAESRYLLEEIFNIQDAGF
ncbi:hypothetical protein MLD38_025015 [Melastoma candidum]|uniref:Uncharacterized protein n=1 Tax=Melastoma candidum TaxID=119954 RepID=A0ACB9NU25_9MYRT|nr:hypothetical protein MLD38_025015 [Melastoma candidum]